MTEKQWKKIRKDSHESIFDRVVMFLDRSIALALWENYLKTESSDIKTIEHRLWLTSLFAYSAYFVKMDESLWVPKEEDNLFLQDAIAYVKQLPIGHIRQLAMEGLFVVTCYVPDDFGNQPINEIRELSKRLLSKNDREGAIIRSEHNKTAMKKWRTYKRSKNDVKQNKKDSK